MKVGNLKVSAAIYRGRVLAGSTQGLHDTLSTISRYQQRSDAILTHLLGRSYGLPDILFYVAGGVVSLGAGAAPLTRSARLPLLSIFGSALAAERLLLERLQPLGMLSPGPDGQVNLVAIHHLCMMYTAGNTC